MRDAEAVGIYDALGVPPATVTALKSGRLDIISAMNILSDPLAEGGFPLAATGDVLRVDLTSPVGFPNGRPLGAAFTGDAWAENDVTDTLATLVLAGLGNLLNPQGLHVSDSVSYNERLGGE